MLKIRRILINYYNDMHINSYYDYINFDQLQPASDDFEKVIFVSTDEDLVKKPGTSWLNSKTGNSEWISTGKISGGDNCQGSFGRLYLTIAGGVTDHYVFGFFGS